jgi:hypothetical protein
MLLREGRWLLGVLVRVPFDSEARETGVEATERLYVAHLILWREEGKAAQVSLSKQCSRSRSLRWGVPGTSEI